MYNFTEVGSKVLSKRQQLSGSRARIEDMSKLWEMRKVGNTGPGSAVQPLVYGKAVYFELGEIL